VAFRALTGFEISCLSHVASLTVTQDSFSAGPGIYSYLS
jgi:hypothetical protein